MICTPATVADPEPDTCVLPDGTRHPDYDLVPIGTGEGSTARTFVPCNPITDPPTATVAPPTTPTPGDGPELPATGSPAQDIATIAAVLVALGATVLLLLAWARKDDFDAAAPQVNT